jgi:hypothetical protein
MGLAQSVAAAGQALPEVHRAFEARSNRAYSYRFSQLSLRAAGKSGSQYVA